MENITLRQLLNIMPAADLLRTSIRLEDKSEFENCIINRVDELRESDSPLLDYGVALFYPMTDIKICKTDNGHCKTIKAIYTVVILKKRNN